MTGPGDITLHLKRWSEGDDAVIEPLFELVYPDLRRIANSLVWSPGSEPMLQPTAVVNELYLKLIQLHSLRLEDRTHFVSRRGISGTRPCIAWAEQERASSPKRSRVGTGSSL